MQLLISYYMDLGNEICVKTGDNAILMKGVVRQLFSQHKKDEKGFAQPRQRIAYIIKSIKYPDEVDFMRETYGDSFHLIGVTSSYERRRKILTERPDA